MAKGTDADAARKLAREAKEQGMSASEAGVSTGASKQINHKTHTERQKDHQESQGKS